MNPVDQIAGMLAEALRQNKVFTDKVTAETSLLYAAAYTLKKSPKEFVDSMESIQFTWEGTDLYLDTKPKGAKPYDHPNNI